MHCRKCDVGHVRECLHWQPRSPQQNQNEFFRRGPGRELLRLTQDVQPGTRLPFAIGELPLKLRDLIPLLLVRAWVLLAHHTLPAKRVLLFRSAVNRYHQS